MDTSLAQTQMSLEALSHLSPLSFFSFFCQILEVEGMSVPDEVSCMLQMVSEYLKEPCPITSLSGSQGPTTCEGLKHAHGDDAAGKARRQANQVKTEG